jgi:uncharacterized protein
MVFLKRSIPGIVLAGVLAVVEAGCGGETGGLEVLHERVVKLPAGGEVRAEVMLSRLEMQRGMMFRDSLARNRGLLFVHGKPGNYRYWMYQVNIPLDIIWLDSGRRVVEILANAQPCHKRASECPSFGSADNAQYVLELGGGEAARLNVRVGQVLDF